ncbi:MAG: hypothetical protein ACOCTG_02940 [Bacteroidota bacterium]
MDLAAIEKNAPEGFTFQKAPFGHAYRYYLSGKGCLLGVLFQDSTHIYFEWLTERDRPVRYSAEIRYEAWRRTDFARLVAAGVWEPSCMARSAAA